MLISSSFRSRISQVNPKVIYFLIVKWTMTLMFLLLLGIFSTPIMESQSTLTSITPMDDSQAGSASGDSLLNGSATSILPDRYIYIHYCICLLWEECSNCGCVKAIIIAHAQYTLVPIFVICDNSSTVFVVCTVAPFYSLLFKSSFV